MKSRPTQFGVRENTASSRQHAPRLVMNALVLQSDPLSATERSDKDTHELVPPIKETFELSLAEPDKGATGGEERDRLLTVHEVADLLHVPVSWVYGRTRKRSVGRLPGIRLGKYWRFREEEVRTWVECQREGHHAA